MYETRNKYLGIKVFILLGVLAAGSFTFARYYNNSRPCARPISYSLGDFDTKFNYSQQQFLSAIDEASRIWEGAIDRDLFVYDSTEGGLKIHLVYDSRQEATDRLKNLGYRIENTQSSYYSLKAQYDREVAEYQSEKASYDAQVSYWNSKGGAPEKEYNQLKKQQQDLNRKVDNINYLAQTLNTLARQLNLNVSSYNNIGESRGEEFEEGVYISDESGQRIEIYEFQDREQLIRLLAHELGHALGLEHIDDPNAIMHRLNSAENETPTTADLVELNRVCRLES